MTRREEARLAVTRMFTLNAHSRNEASNAALHAALDELHAAIVEEQERDPSPSPKAKSK